MINLDIPFHWWLLFALIVVAWAALKPPRRRL